MTEPGAQLAGGQPAPAAGPIPSAGRSKYLALVAMLFAVAMTFIDQTIVAIAAPSIQAHLNLTRSGTQWIVNAYLLALAASFALGGRLADVLGSRRMVIVGIIGFATSSALCGLTPTGAGAQAWIVIFRVLQGFSAAIMFPAALAIVVAAFPVHERGRALAVFFGVSGGLTAIGPIAGGFLTQWTWRAIFWINVPVAVIALTLTLIAELPSTRRRVRIDGVGAVLVALGMALSVLGFEQAPQWSWSSPLTWLCIIGGLVVLGLFARFEAGTTDPLMNIRIFRDRAFVVVNLVLLFSSLSFIPVFFFASIYAQTSLGYDANHAGLFLLVYFAGFATAAQIGGRMYDRSGARRPIIIGSALGVVGYALWASKVTDLSLGAQWPFIVIAAAGVGLLLGPASTDAVNHAIDASYGEVTGITQTIRNYGSALGIAVFSTILTTVYTNHLVSSLGSLGFPANVATAIAHGSQNQVPRHGGLGLSRVPSTIAQDFAIGIRAVLIGMAVALALSFIAARRYPRTAADSELESDTRRAMARERRTA